MFPPRIEACLKDFKQPTACQKLLQDCENRPGGTSSDHLKKFTIPQIGSYKGVQGTPELQGGSFEANHSPRRARLDGPWFFICQNGCRPGGWIQNSYFF